MRVSLRTRLLLAFASVLLLTIAVSSLAYVNTQQHLDATGWVRHTEQVIDAANETLVTIDDMDARYREYLLTGSAFALAAYRVDVDRYPTQLDALSNLTADNPPQVARWRGIKSQIDALRADVLEPAIALRQRVSDGTASLQDAINFDTSGLEQRPMANLRDGFTEAIGVERSLLADRTQAADKSDSMLLNVLVWGTLATILLGVAIAAWLARDIGHAMTRLASVANTIAGGDLSQRIRLQRKDEIGQAARAFDSMAATLQADVAERVRVQAQTDSILNSAAEGIYAIDTDGRATLVNESSAILTGYAVAELQGQDVHTTVHHSRADGSPYPLEECPIRCVLRDGMPRHVRGEVFWRRDGSRFPVEYTAMPIQEQNRVTGVVVTYHDISDRLAVERMKDEFISMVSHELRTPLTSIRGSLGLLEAGLLGPITDKARRMLEVALSNTDRLIRLINDILDIERIESGRVAMEPHRTDARALIDRCIESLSATADAAGVQVVNTAEDISLVVDVDRVLQMLTNLLGNAIKFSPRGARIELAAEREGTWAHFHVRDQGRGIPPDKLESIFGKFEQVDASDSREKGGTGLGLAISRSIVQQHGGKIWVESRLGQGSTFHFTLPLTTVATPIPAPDDPTRESPSILVVDDDPAVLEIVSDMLAEQGYRAVTASGGREGTRRAAAERPSAILLDLSMPDMSGWDALVALKDDDATREIPVLLMSGLDRVRDERTQQTQGWVSKPIAPETLSTLIGRVLARQAGPARLLVVEDDEDLARVLCETFVAQGVQAEHAATSDEAIAISQRFEPDLLLLDLALSRGDGFEIVDWYRQRDRLRRVPVVVYTARDLTERERERLHLGPTEFLTKSRIAPEEVRRRVLGLLERVVPADQAEKAHR